MRSVVASSVQGNQVPKIKITGHDLRKSTRNIAVLVIGGMLTQIPTAVICTAVVHTPMRF